MPRAKTMKIEQIEAAKTLLRALPAKEREKTREEAATLLNKDVQTAFSKGYTIKELTEILKKEGVIIPASLLKCCVTAQRRSADRK